MSGHLLIFTADSAMAFGSLVLIAGNLVHLPRSRNAWLVSAILLGGICASVLGRYQYGFWIPEPYRVDVGAWEPLLNASSAP